MAYPYSGKPSHRVTIITPRKYDVVEDGVSSAASDQMNKQCREPFVYSLPLFIEQYRSDTSPVSMQPSQPSRHFSLTILKILPLIYYNSSLGPLLKWHKALTDYQ